MTNTPRLRSLGLGGLFSAMLLGPMQGGTVDFLHPIAVGAALFTAASLLTLGFRLLMPGSVWSSRGYFGQYSLLIGAAGFLFFYCTLPAFGIFPALEKWTGIGFWIISVLGAGYGLFMCLAVFISNRLPRKPPPSP